MQKIVVEHGAINEIAAQVGCSRNTVAKALSCKLIRSQLQREIRQLAHERYSLDRKQKRVGHKIVVPLGEITNVALAMGVDVRTVRKALRGYEGSRTAVLVREEAVKNHGGQYVDERGDMLDSVQFYGTMMIQHFGHGITLEADRETGLVKLYQVDTLLDSAIDPSIDVLMSMQERAVKLSKDMGE